MEFLKVWRADYSTILPKQYRYYKKQMKPNTIFFPFFISVTFMHKNNTPNIIYILNNGYGDVKAVIMRHPNTTYRSNGSSK